MVCTGCAKEIDQNEGFVERPLCASCYWQDYKARSLTKADNICSGCGTASSTKWYAGPKCCSCYGRERNKINYAANPDKYKNYQKQFRKQNPDKIKAQSLKKFGITLEDYYQMLAEQDGKCAICKSKNPGRAGIKFFPVDHDHVTGKVRSLLCSWCNKGIGLLKDDPAILRVAAEYIERHKSK